MCSSDLSVFLHALHVLSSFLLVELHLFSVVLHHLLVVSSFSGMVGSKLMKSLLMLVHLLHVSSVHSLLGSGLLKGWLLNVLEFWKLGGGGLLESWFLNGLEFWKRCFLNCCLLDTLSGLSMRLDLSSVLFSSSSHLVSDFSLLLSELSHVSSESFADLDELWSTSAWSSLASSSVNEL